MAMLTVRNLPDEVHRALRVRAALRGRSTEAEVRAILAETVLPEERARLGTLLTEIGRRGGVKDEEVSGLCATRYRSGSADRSRMILVDTNPSSRAGAPMLYLLRQLRTPS